jgi:hypothetical protein
VKVGASAGHRSYRDQPRTQDNAAADASRIEVFGHYNPNDAAPASSMTRLSIDIPQMSAHHLGPF